MSSNDDIRARLTAKFLATTRDRVSKLNAAFGALEQGRGDASAADSLMREIHTLKGESRIMNFGEVNEISHVTESLLNWARDRGFRTSSEAADLIYWGLDLILSHLGEDRASEGHASKRADFFRSAEALLSASTEKAKRGETMKSEAAEEKPAPRSTPSSTFTDQALPPTPTTDTGTTGELQAQGVGQGLGDFIRVSGETVGDLTSLAGELLIHQEAMSREIQGLWDELRRESSALADRREGEGPVEALRRLREQAFESRLRLGELQDTVRRLRLLEVSALFGRYPAATRELARERGKRVRVVLQGGDVAVDKQVLDLVDESVLHMVRNSVDHAIESAKERKAAGKSAHGTIVLAARQLGPRVEISVSDDGRGMDPDYIRQSALERGIVTEAEASALDNDAALELIFRAGFSTRKEVSDVSGRGVGLDVVHDQVQGLGGSIEVSTGIGRGTSFTLLLPISVALTRILCIRCGTVLFGLPSANVDQVFRAALAEMETAGDGLALRYEGGRVPLVDLRRTFGGPAGGEDGEVHVVVIEHANQRIGLAVDEFLGERQAVQRSLGRFLGGLRLIAGTVILEKRQVALLLSVPELLRRWGEGDTKIVHTLHGKSPESAAWRVAIVDDSELTRDMLVGLARRARLSVLEAVNGRDALTKMRSHPPDLVLTDLDMPVMDGFELIAALRRDAALQDLPLIVLSTRGSDEDKRRAMAAGANDYIVKSEFSEETLHDALGRFLDVRFR